MSIEKLEMWRSKYMDKHGEWYNDHSDEFDIYYCIQNFMFEVINTFKEDVIDVNDIKEVKNING